MIYPNDSQPSPNRLKGLLLAIGALVVVGGGAWWFFASSGSKKPTARPQEFTMVQVTLPPPPPPPPPPPRPEPEPRQQESTPDDSRDMIAQEPIAADQPDTAPTPDAANEADAPMGTNVQSDGPPDGFGLVGRGSGGTIGGRGGIGGRAGTGGGRWGWYAAQVQRSIEDALRQHESTRSAQLRITVRIWPDDNGHIARAVLDESTGNTELDAILRDQILTGLQLRDVPPADMPRPITLRITAQRPN